MTAHVDLQQTWARRVTYTAAGLERYEVYPHSAYVLSARLVSVGSTNQFSSLLLTSEAPSQDGDDIPRIPLYIDFNGRSDSVDYPRGVLFMKGIYAKTEAATDGDEAYLEVIFVDRRHFCDAFPRVEGSIVDCWNEARNKGVSVNDPTYDPYLTDFTFYERDNPENPVDEPTDGDSSQAEPI